MTDSHMYPPICPNVAVNDTHVKLDSSEFVGDLCHGYMYVCMQEHLYTCNSLQLKFSRGHYDDVL
jgi:hypothetical protein